MTDATPESVLARMRSTVAVWHAARDRRAIFLDCYSRMTANMLSALADGAFVDAPRTASLLTRFAGFYFDALAAWEADPNAAPAPWRIAFDAARTPSAWAVQDLLLGVNAHINHDLALTVAEIYAEQWAGMDAGARAVAQVDFSRVNDIIAATIDEVQDQVLEPFDPVLNMFDVAMGPMDEWLISRLVVSWRARVWEHAVYLLEARDSARREATRNQIVSSTVRIAEAILGRSGPLGAFTVMDGL